MSRIQLALNVSDLDASIAFYTTLLGVGPHKLRPGYANFAVADPPLKLVLFEVPAADRGTGTTGALNHLGIEVFDADEVAAATERLTGAGLPARIEDATLCCHAVQDKVWADDPSGAPWEVYVVTDDDPDESAATLDLASTGTCCGDQPTGSTCCVPAADSA